VPKRPGNIVITVSVAHRSYNGKGKDTTNQKNKKETPGRPSRSCRSGSRWPTNHKEALDKAQARITELDARAAAAEAANITLTDNADNHARAAAAEADNAAARITAAEARAAAAEAERDQLRNELESKAAHAHHAPSALQLLDSISEMGRDQASIVVSRLTSLHRL
jgi:hypothetical protein